MDETMHLARASSEIDGLTSRTEAHLAEVEKVRTNNNLTEEYRRARVAEMRAEHGATIRAALTSARESFTEAERLAARSLATPDPEMEARKLRASVRVARVLDSKGPAAALEAFTDDPDALRELRDQLPSWTAAQDMRPGDRQGMTDGLRLRIDEALRPHATPAEAAAIDVRTRLDEERARLDATAQWAANPTPSTSVLRAYASTPTPRVVNGRLERSGAS